MDDEAGPPAASAQEPGAAVTGPVDEPRPPAVIPAEVARPDKPPAPLEVKRTRTSATYVGVAFGLIVVILVLIIVVQNLGESSVHLFTWRFKLPEGVIVLASAVAGGLIVFLVSLARVLQLRVMARRHQRRHVAAGS